MCTSTDDPSLEVRVDTLAFLPISPMPLIASCTIFWISSASTESEGTETDPMTKLLTSRGAEGRVEGVAPPGVELGGRAVGGSLWTTCMTFP